jgi:hypothetical protein
MLPGWRNNTGFVPWQFTSQAISQGAGSLVLDADLISKVYFPRLALPISKALGLILDLAIALVVVVIVTLAYGVSISSMVYLVPAFLVLGVITAFGLATLLAALNVKYRDVQVLVPMLVQILFFASPVLYSGTIVGQTSGEVWSYLYYVNPMATVLKGVHGSGIEHPFPDPFALMGPQADADLILPIIDDFQETTGFIAIVFWMRGTRLIGKWWPTLRKLYLNLGKSEQGSEEQDNSQNAVPSNRLARHRRSFLSRRGTEDPYL